MLAYLAALKSVEKAEKDPSQNQNELGQVVGDDMSDWTSAKQPTDETMVGHFCRLERLDPAKHAEDLYEAFSVDTEGRNWTYLDEGPFPDFKSFEAYVKELATGNDPFAFAIIEQEGGKALGIASYMNIVPETGSIEVGHIHFSPLLQRKCGGTEAMFLMMQRVFDKWGYRRYEWRCNALNKVSRKAAVRLGFSYEGTLRQASVVKGKNLDTAWFSVLDSEWPVLRASFEKWLSPANFKEDGARIKTLSELIAREETRVF
ncbi:GNAT family N-acetyltransferase [Pseudovibrio denitrificans]|uniref:GNAT family N-acetyltransferase n=1 Tax=Pseudovibrio denitrificans TaxID=258256 RepID=UPI0039BEEF55